LHRFKLAYVVLEVTSKHDLANLTGIDSSILSSFRTHFQTWIS